MPVLQATPFVHRGFLSRAKTVPIEGLYGAACRKGKRLVLTGNKAAAHALQAGDPCLLHVLEAVTVTTQYFHHP